MPTKVTDEEFLGIWAKYHSAQKVAVFFGQGERWAHQRRRALESKLNIDLLSADEVMRSDAYRVVLNLTIDNGTIVLGSDPHYNPLLPPSTAHRALVRFLPALRPDYVIMNGDLSDFGQISRHHRIGFDQQIKVKDEIECLQDRMDEIFKASRNARHIRTIGNHCIRVDGIVGNLLPQFQGVKGTRLSDHLPGWEETWTVQVNEPCELLILHRWRSSLHAPLLNVREAGCSVATGHLHRAAEYEHTYINNRQCYGIDAGTMAELHDGTNPSFLYTEGRPLNWRAGWWRFRFIDGRLMPPERCRVIDKDKVWWRGELHDV